MTAAEAAAGGSGSWRQVVAGGVRWQGSGQGCLSAGSLGLGTKGLGATGLQPQRLRCRHVSCRDPALAPGPCGGVPAV